MREALAGERRTSPRMREHGRHADDAQTTHGRQTTRAEGGTMREEGSRKRGCQVAYPTSDSTWRCLIRRTQAPDFICIFGSDLHGFAENIGRYRKLQKDTENKNPFTCANRERVAFQMAEEEGFEPSLPGLRVKRFSRPPHSTTLPPLRMGCDAWVFSSAHANRRAQTEPADAQRATI